MIEMLVVLMIMGIILALGASVATSILKDADKQETISRLKIVQAAIETFYEERKKWPASLNDLAAVKPCTDLLRKLPEDCMDTGANSVTVRDAYGNNIIYDATGAPGGGAMVYSGGPDGQSGSKKDNILSYEH